MFEKGKQEDEPNMMNDLHASTGDQASPKTTVSKSDKQVETVILAGMQFRGDIKGSHNLFLNGEFDGTVDLNALLFVPADDRPRRITLFSFAIIFPASLTLSSLPFAVGSTDSSRLRIPSGVLSPKAQ